MSKNVEVPASIGELIDKLTILEIKIEKILDAEKRKNCLHEYELLMNIADNNDISFPTIKSELKAVNEGLWDLENNIREKDAKGEFDKNSDIDIFIQ